MLEVRPQIAAAVAEGRPVVALESAFLTHGLPAPRNLQTARAMARRIEQAGALPAMVAVTAGRLVIGLEPDEVESLAAAREVAKVSRRDLGPVLAGGGLGATTVAATLTAAAAAGVRVLATGGIGGVHRGGQGDVSADLPQIARSPVAVVCSGAKAILDLPRTLESLESLGVPVVGYGTGELPAFYSPASGLPLAHRVEDAAGAAAALAAHWRVEAVGVVIAVSPPAASALERREIEPLIDAALAAAAARGITGAATTPFLLDRLAAASAGRTVDANVALLAHNASVAARIAGALATGGG